MTARPAAGSARRALVWAAGFFLAAGAATVAAQQPPGEEDKDWSVEARAGAEYDSNISVAERDLSTGESDVAAVFELGAEFRLPETEGFAVELGYDFSQSIHADLSDFDLQTNLFSASVEREVEGIDFGLRLQHSRASLGGDGFLRMTSFTPSAAYFFGEAYYLMGYYRYTDKNFVVDPGRDGDNNAVGADLFIIMDDGERSASLGARIESENTQADEFDYDGFAVSASFSTPVRLLGRDEHFRARYHYLKKNFDSITPAIGELRVDKRHALRLDYEVPVWKQVAARLRFQYTSSQSNLPSADYNASVLELTLAANF